MRSLSHREIQQFAGARGCHGLVVYNFLATLGSLSPASFHFRALADQAVLFGWGPATVRAISRGISFAALGAPLAGLAPRA